MTVVATTVAGDLGFIESRGDDFRRVQTIAVGRTVYSFRIGPILVSMVQVTYRGTTQVVIANLVRTLN